MAAALRQADEAVSGSEVYFIRRAHDDFIKIGFSRHPERRMRALSLAAGMRMALLGSVAGGHGLEQALHARFEHLRTVGEWFRPDDDLLVEIHALTGWRPRYTDRLWKEGRYSGLAAPTQPAPSPADNPA